MDLTGFYWVLLGFTGFFTLSSHLSISIYFYFRFINSNDEKDSPFLLLYLIGSGYWVLLGFTGFFWVCLLFSFYQLERRLGFINSGMKPHLIKLLWGSLGFTVFFKVLPSFHLFLHPSIYQSLSFR